MVAGDPQRDGSPQRVQGGLAALAIRGHRRPGDQVPVHRDAKTASKSTRLIPSTQQLKRPGRCHDDQLSAATTPTRTTNP